MRTIAVSKSFESAEPATTAHEGTQAIVTLLHGAQSLTTAELLKELRRAFPDMPLSQRVAALTGLLRL